MKSTYDRMLENLEFVKFTRSFEESANYFMAKMGDERALRLCLAYTFCAGLEAKQDMPDTSILDRILEPLDQFAASVGYGIPPALTYFPQREEDYKAGYFGCKAQLKIELMHIRADAEKDSHG